MTNRVLCGLLLVALGQGLASCGGSGSMSTPSAPSAVSQSTPRVGTQGLVVDTADRRLAGAVVEVVNGPHAGASATTNATGEFLLTGTFDDTTLFRVTKEGHVPATQPQRRSASFAPYLLFYLSVLTPPVNIAGDYTLTFIADGACAAALPADLRTRTYAATITDASYPNYPANTRFKIEPSGADFEAPYTWFSVGIAGGYLAFWLGDEHLREKLAAGTYLDLIGAAVAVTTSGASTISASFDGTYAACASRNHQLILTRR
jgi:hypothetical protein